MKRAEATAYSSAFYAHVLNDPGVEDHFFIRGETLDFCRREFREKLIRRLKEATADEDKYFPGVLGNPVTFAGRWGLPLTKGYRNFKAKQFAAQKRRPSRSKNGRHTLHRRSVPLLTFAEFETRLSSHIKTDFENETRVWQHVRLGIAGVNRQGPEKIPSNYAGRCRAYERCSKQLARSDIALPGLELADGYNTRQVLNYAYRSWRDFFNNRQLLALGWLHEAILELPDDAARAAMLTTFSGALEFNNMFASYKGEGTGAIRHMFAHHILKPERVPIEGNVWITSKSSGSFSTLFRSRLLRAIEYRQTRHFTPRVPSALRQTRHGEHEGRGSKRRRERAHSRRDQRSDFRHASRRH